MNELSKQMQRDIVLIDELVSGNSENGCIEFKHNNESPEMIGKCFRKNESLLSAFYYKIFR